MNYLTEIKMFYDWLETHTLSDSAVAMWHGLMFIANRAGWQENLTVSMESLRLRTQIPRSSIYRVREQLEEAGLIKVIQQGGRNCPVYVLQSFESQLASQFETQSANRTAVESQDESHSGTQTANREGFESHSGTQTANINKTKQDVNVKKQTKKKKVSEVDEWVAGLESPWQELMRIWFEYKKSRKEAYATVMGAKSCLTKLRNLSGNNPQTAQAVIEQSMANNWAGLFPVKDAAAARGHPPSAPATGQRIGQILQPQTEEHRQSILEKFRSGIKTGDTIPKQ